MSNHNSMHQLKSLDASALARFFANFSASQQQIEQSLLMLELSPNDRDLLADLQQGIAQIQQYLVDIGLDSIQPLTISINKLLDAIQHRKIIFETLMSDLILLAVEDIKTIIEKIIEDKDRGEITSRLPRICEGINEIINAHNQSRDALIKDVLLLLDPSMEIIENSSFESDSLLNLFSKDQPGVQELAAYGVVENDDFLFFRSLSKPLEGRAKYWYGRSHRMLRLALKMNDQIGRPVEPNQLAAAIYMHDAGMALLPQDIINGEAELTADQREQIKQHPVVGYELMRYMKVWREASIIVLQHHEQSHGGGYPYGLDESEICEGAKILAIVDAIDARTHERAHATLLKRPLLRAAIELGKNSGLQFSEKWVDVFKSVFQEMRKVA